MIKTRNNESELIHRIKFYNHFNTYFYQDILAWKNGRLI